MSSTDSYKGKYEEYLISQYGPLPEDKKKFSDMTAEDFFDYLVAPFRTKQGLADLNDTKIKEQSDPIRLLRTICWLQTLTRTTANPPPQLQSTSGKPPSTTEPNSDENDDILYLDDTVGL